MALKSLSDLSISERVTNELREAIHSGEFAPGDRLVERKLAETMGVSHIPIREALARLTDEGLVEREPRRGARVAALSATELDEISSLRAVLEGFVVERVQQRWSPAHEAQLRKIVDQMAAAATKGNVDRMYVLDLKFHELVWSMAEHETLMGVASQLRSRISGFLRAANSALESGDLATHVSAHESLIDAIASGDLDRAKQAMSEHIVTATVRLEAQAEPRTAKGE